MARMERPRDDRQRVLGAVFIGFIVLTAVALFEVLGTIFLALTIAYILSPIRRWFRNHGVGRTVATLIVTVGASLAILAILAPVAFVLFVRLDDAISVVLALPDVFELEAFGVSYELLLEDVTDLMIVWLRDAALAASVQLPVLLVKFVLFVFIVFALLQHERDIASNLIAVVPPRHRDIVESLHQRAQATLFAIYVLQGATAFVTVLIALPVFYVFGYETWFALGTLAGILQFVPVVGPSALILLLVIGEVLAAEFVRAAMLLIIGGGLIAAVPDLVVRPQLAKRTTRMSSALYFVGFVGGLLSLGAIGIIVGPLVVALLAESANLLAVGFDDRDPQPADSHKTEGS